MRVRRATLPGSALLAAAALAGAIAPAQAFEGRWIAGDGAYAQALTIAKLGRGLQGKGSVATRGCVGEFEGTGRAVGDDLVRRARRDGLECRITAKLRSPTELVVDEEGCLAFHGAACEFSGTYRLGARQPR